MQTQPKRILLLLFPHLYADVRVLLQLSVVPIPIPAPFPVKNPIEPRDASGIVAKTETPKSSPAMTLVCNGTIAAVSPSSSQSDDDDDGFRQTFPPQVLKTKCGDLRSEVYAGSREPGQQPGQVNHPLFFSPTRTAPHSFAQQTGSVTQSRPNNDLLVHTYSRRPRSHRGAERNVQKTGRKNTHTNARLHVCTVHAHPLALSLVHTLLL